VSFIFIISKAHPIDVINMKKIPDDIRLMKRRCPHFEDENSLIFKD